MKVMNVGNTNYSKPKQQNFGMNLDFAKSAVEMIGTEDFEKLLKKAARLNNQGTLKGSVLSCKRKEILLEAPQIGVNRVIVSGTPTGENTFGNPYSTLYGNLDFALRTIDRL